MVRFAFSKVKSEENDTELENLQRSNRNPRIKLFNKELIKIFQKQLLKLENFDHNEISYIKKSYQIHHDDAQTSLFFEHLRNAGGNTRTIETIVDLVNGLEIEFHGGKEIRAIECFMKQTKSPLIKNWLINYLDRGIFYKIRKTICSLENFAFICFGSAHNGLLSDYVDTIKLIWSSTFAIITIVLFYFDFYKDVMLFSIFNHIWAEILV